MPAAASRASGASDFFMRAFSFGKTSWQSSDASRQKNLASGV